MKDSGSDRASVAWPHFNTANKNVGIPMCLHKNIGRKSLHVCVSKCLLVVVYIIEIDLSTSITSLRKFSGASLYGVNCSDLCITSTLLSTRHILLPFSRCPPMDLALLERPLSTILDKHSSFWLNDWVQAARSKGRKTHLFLFMWNCYIYIKYFTAVYFFLDCFSYFIKEV